MSSPEVRDYDTWRRFFDTDPLDHEHVSTGHRLYRGVENPNQIVIQGEFGSSEEAASFRERLLSSGVIDKAGAKLDGPPIAVDEAEAVAY
jgi:hypothetical protein